MLRRITMQDGSGNALLQQSMDHIVEGTQEMRPTMPETPPNSRGSGSFPSSLRAHQGECESPAPVRRFHRRADCHPETLQRRNRTFFFTDMEWKTAPISVLGFQPTVPLEAWRQGDFPNMATAIRDPFNGNTPFPGNRLPVSRLNSVALGLQDFWPLPNVGDRNQFASRNQRAFVNSRPGNLPIRSSRIDHRFSDKSFLFDVFNHPNYWQPATNISVASQMGQVAGVQNLNNTSDTAAMRIVELQVRLEW